jgi:hypothetical protein
MWLQDREHDMAVSKKEGKLELMQNLVKFVPIEQLAQASGFSVEELSKSLHEMEGNK